MAIIEVSCVPQPPAPSTNEKGLKPYSLGLCVTVQRYIFTCEHRRRGRTERTDNREGAQVQAPAKQEEDREREGQSK